MLSGLWIEAQGTRSLGMNERGFRGLRYGEYDISGAGRCQMANRYIINAGLAIQEDGGDLESAGVKAGACVRVRIRWIWNPQEWEERYLVGQAIEASTGRESCKTSLMTVCG